MGFSAVHNLNHLLALYGYWAVLVFVAIESTGIPFPGETMLIAAGIYAGSTHHLTIWLVIAAAAAGAIIGDNFGYFIGREGGYRLVRKYGHFIRLDERKLKLGQYLFMKHGGKVVFFGRFVSVLRAWAAFLAGVDRMEWPRFFFFNAAGGILWAFLYGIGSYLLGNNVHRFAGPVGIGIGVAAAIIIIAFLVFLWRNERRLEDEAEKVLPGSIDEYQGPKGDRKRRELRNQARQKKANRRKQPLLSRVFPPLARRQEKPQQPPSSPAQHIRPPRRPLIRDEGQPSKEEEAGEQKGRRRVG